MPDLYAGVDGGQSSTIAVIVDADGNRLGRAVAGPSDHVGEPADSQRAALACEGAVVDALRDAGLPPAARLTAVAIGLSGYEGAWHGLEPSFPGAIVRYEHDAVIALAGAIAARPAAVVIAGTGSAAYGERANGEAVRAGGFGYLFGDQGSSFAIARAALAGAMRSSDGGAITNLGEAALGFFDAPDLRALARAVSLGEITRPQLAGFARVVLDAARLGDADAGTIVDAAAGDLAALAAQVVGQLAAGADAPVPVAFVGGAVENAGLRAGVARRVEAAAPWARVVDPAHEAAFGAALLAFDAAGAARPSA